MAVDTTEASYYRPGAGSAFIWGENKALKGLEQAYQQDQLRKQKEEAELADQVSKINYDAARESDLPEILKRYSGIKNTFAKIRGTQNSMDRIKLQSELNQQKAELSRAVALSKQAAQQEGDLGKLPLSNPDNISDDFVSNYSKLRKLSVFDPEYQKQAEYITANGVLPKYDHISTAKKIADASIQKMAQSGVKTENLAGGAKSYYTESGQKLDRDALSQNVVLEAQRNRGLRNEIQKLYPDLGYSDAVKSYSDDLYEGMKGKYDETKRTGASVIKPDDWREKMDYQDALIRGRAKDGINDVNYASQPVTLPFAGGKASTTSPDFVKISLPKKNFVGSEAIDLATGKATKATTSSNDYEVVGVGNFPFIKKGVEVKKNNKGQVLSRTAIGGGLAQSDYKGEVEMKPMIQVDFFDKENNEQRKLLVPYSSLPANLSKREKEILSRFNTSTPVSTKQKSNTETSLKGKTYGGIDKNGNPIWK